MSEAKHLFRIFKRFYILVFFTLQARFKMTNGVLGFFGRTSLEIRQLSLPCRVKGNTLNAS
ncbi:hypothetical protein [Helicobacter mesocricetorum]|uniref:hypothetical protein n=1 Tax=Helicobacter mesocricetorum TaxID=87012 RepID=UPI00131582AB|nr:hypothetical protein [Helicobacter mesocricetorum]